MHAPAEEQPKNSQSFTFCFAMDYLKGEDHTIEKPRDYGFWKEYVPKMTPPWTGALLSWSMSEPKTLKKRDAYFEPDAAMPPQPGMNLWTYRRIADPANFQNGTYRGAISLVNWPQERLLAGRFGYGFAERGNRLHPSRETIEFVVPVLDANGRSAG